MTVDYEAAAGSPEPKRAPGSPPVRAERLSHQLPTGCSRWLSYALHPGEKLPSELELCELLGVPFLLAVRDCSA